VERIQRAIGDIARKVAPQFVSPEDTVRKAIEAMWRARTSCVLVTAEGKLQGIFTERDFLCRVAAEGRSPGETRVGEVMTENPETLGVDHNVAYAINKMIVEGFRNIPVLDDSGQAVLVVSVRDIIEQLAEIFGDVAAALEEEPDSEWVDTGGG